MSFSPAMLLDRNAMRQSIGNGTSTLISPSDPDFTSLLRGARQGSEPPQFSFNPTSSSEVSSSKDDAHDILVHKGKKQASSKSQVNNPVPKTLFDAKQLLDPKSFKTGQRAKDKRQKDTTTESNEASDAGSKRGIEEHEGPGTGSLIERMHNVSQREERPQKRQKLDDAEQKEKDTNSTFTGAKKGGDLGDYIKEERKKGLESNGVNGALELAVAGRSFSRWLPFTLLSTPNMYDFSQLFLLSTLPWFLVNCQRQPLPFFLLLIRRLPPLFLHLLTIWQ